MNLLPLQNYERQSRKEHRAWVGEAQPPFHLLFFLLDGKPVLHPVVSVDGGKEQAGEKLHLL